MKVQHKKSITFRKKLYLLVLTRYELSEINILESLWRVMVVELLIVYLIHLMMFLNWVHR